MMRTLVLAAVASFALLGGGCDQNSGDIFPMTVGSTWHMDVTIMSSGSTASLDTVGTGTVVYTMAEKVNLTAGPEVTRYQGVESFHSLIPESTYTDTFNAYYREEGDWILSYSTLDDTSPDTVMVTTPTLGKTWHQGGVPTEVMAQENVTVPAGTYRKAWKVRSSSNQSGLTVEMLSWYAPGIGLVRARNGIVYQADSMVAEEALTSATIK